MQKKPAAEFDKLLALIESGHTEQLKKLHSADLATVMENSPPQERLSIWNSEYPQRGGELLLELNDSVIEQLVPTLPLSSLHNALRQIDASDLAELSEFLPPQLLEQRLAELSWEEQHWVQSTMQYPAESVGSEMSKEMVLVYIDEMLQDVLQRLRELTTLPEHNDKMFVVKRSGELVGLLPWQCLVLNEPTQSVKKCMVTDVVSFSPTEEMIEAASAFEKYDLVSAPVVNHRGVPIGRLTVDEALDTVWESGAEDVLNTAGLYKEEDLFAPIWNSAKNRWGWLALSLATAFLAVYVIGLFEETILKYVALAALMPIVAALGGNTGNQTTTLVVRALALEQVNRSNLWHLVRKEFGLSLLNGLFWGFVVGLFAWLVYADLGLSKVIASAMLLTMLLAAAFGLSIPLLLHYILKRDPALGSNVLVTALTDSIGFFIFLGLASLFL